MCGWRDPKNNRQVREIYKEDDELCQRSRSMSRVVGISRAEEPDWLRPYAASRSRTRDTNGGPRAPPVVPRGVPPINTIIPLENATPTVPTAAPAPARTPVDGRIQQRMRLRCRQKLMNAAIPDAGTEMFRCGFGTRRSPCFLFNRLE